MLRLPIYWYKRLPVASIRNIPTKIYLFFSYECARLHSKLKLQLSANKMFWSGLDVMTSDLFDSFAVWSWVWSWFQTDAMVHVDLIVWCRDLDCLSQLLSINCFEALHIIGLGGKFSYSSTKNCFIYFTKIINM